MPLYVSHPKKSVTWEKSDRRRETEKGELREFPFNRESVSASWQLTFSLGQNRTNTINLPRKKITGENIANSPGNNYRQGHTKEPTPKKKKMAGSDFGRVVAKVRSKNY